MSTERKYTSEIYAAVFDQNLPDDGLRIEHVKPVDQIDYTDISTL